MAMKITDECTNCGACEPECPREAIIEGWHGSITEDAIAKALQLASEALAAHPDEFALEPLLLYVLTHELIHVVRFGTLLQRIDLPVDQRVREEARVDRTTHRILRRLGDPGMRPVLDNFRYVHPDIEVYSTKME